MRIELAHITPRRGRLKSAPAQALLDDYVARASRYAPCAAVAYDSEGAFLQAFSKAEKSGRASLCLLDSRGQSLTSEVFAAQLGRQQVEGTQLLLCAIGPADGWSPTAWARASLRLSFGAMTMPHELALVVLAEQVYRALTILAGHPYHGGHR